MAGFNREAYEAALASAARDSEALSGQRVLVTS